LGINPLLKGFLVDDDLIAVDQMFFQLVRQNSLERVHFIGIAHFLDNFCDLVVQMSRFDQSQGGLGGFVGSQDHIGLFTCHLGILVRLHNDGMCDEGGETIDVDSQLNFDQIAFLDVC